VSSRVRMMASLTCVHVVDAADGRVLQSLPIPSAPSWLAAKGDRVYVARYDGEAEFRDAVRAGRKRRAEPSLTRTPGRPPPGRRTRPRRGDLGGKMPYCSRSASRPGRGARCRAARSPRPSAPGRRRGTRRGPSCRRRRERLRRRRRAP
jgi:hypothetical protein